MKPDIEYEVMLLGRHLAWVSGGISGTARPDRLDRSAYTLLSRMEVQGPMTIAELADAFGLDQSTLNRQTAAMTRAGLVERIPDPDGGLARKFRVTARGAERLAADRDTNRAATAKVVAGWTEQEVAGFATALRRFNTDVERLSGRPWPRPDQG